MKKNKAAYEKQNINEESKGFISGLTDKNKPMLGKTKPGNTSDQENHHKNRPNSSSRYEHGSNH